MQNKMYKALSMYKNMLSALSVVLQRPMRQIKTSRGSTY